MSSSDSEIQKLFDDFNKNFANLNFCRIKPNKINSLLENLKRLLLLKSSNFEVIKWRCNFFLGEYNKISTLWLNTTPQLQNEIKEGIITYIEKIPSSCEAEKNSLKKQYKAFFNDNNKKKENNKNYKELESSDKNNQKKKNYIIDLDKVGNNASSNKKNELILSNNYKEKSSVSDNSEEQLLSEIDKIISESNQIGNNVLKKSTSILEKKKNDKVLRTKYDNENNIQTKNEVNSIKKVNDYKEKNQGNYYHLNLPNNITMFYPKQTSYQGGNNQKLYTNINTLEKDEKEKEYNCIRNNRHYLQNTFDSTDANNFLPNNPVKPNEYNKENQRQQIRKEMPSNISKENAYHNKSRSCLKKQKKEKAANRLEELITIIKGFGSPLQFLYQFLPTDNGKTIFEKLRDYKKEYLSTDSLNKLLTLTCLFFPFLSKSQKNELKEKLTKIVPSTIINYLDCNLLYSFPQIGEQSRDVILSLILSKPLPTTFNLKITNEKELIDKYILFTIYKSLKKQKNDFYIYHKQIMFSLITVLSNYDKIPFLKKSSKIFNALYLIKNFYTLLDRKYDKEYLTYSEIDKHLRFNDTIISDNDFYALTDLFSDEEFEYYSLVINTIQTFYEIDKNNEILLVNTSFNLSFVNSIIELIEFKREHLYNNISSYRDNLIKLETEIASLVIKRETELSQLSIDSKLQKKFNNFYSLIKSNFMTEDFSLYPFGSITQFLSNESSDLDIYIDLSRIKDKVNFLTKLDQFINNNIDHHSKATISTRICVISLTFDNLKIDLSYLGFCPYLHSNILRTYSLIDARFSILVICVKHIIKKLQLKNVGYNKFYLNSFCWVMLLITFLQDIIKPAILPKLLENAKQTKKQISLGGKNKLFSNLKTFTNFCSNTYKTDIIAPVDNYKNYIEIYETTIREKNNMSVSEILIKFFEFVSYYFKSDAIYINFFFKGEGIQNISYIFLNKEYDVDFYSYYNKKYKEHQMKKYNIMTEKDGVILFREPFDGHYNPGQTFRDKIKVDEFYEKIRNAYKTLILEGSFEKITFN